MPPGIFTRQAHVHRARRVLAAAENARRSFAAAGLPTFETPDEAVRGFMHLVQYTRAQNALMEVPPALAEGLTPDVAKARQIIADAPGRYEKTGV